jgi:hypothetical protein
MLKQAERLAPRLLRGGGLLALLLALAQAAPAEQAKSRAASTRGDAAVTRSGTAGTASRRDAAPAAATSRDDGGGRHAVARQGDREPSRDRRRGTGRHGGGRHDRPVVVIGGGGWYNDPWYWGWGGHWGWWGPWWGWGPSGVGYDRPYRGSGEAYGALDLDLWPEDAEVYVDGERVGDADDFDGFPAFLWLPRGTYDVVFYRDGYRTLARQYSIYAGQVIDVEDRLEKGDSVRPEDLPSSSTTNRDARLRRDRERQEAVREREEWRQRQRRDYDDDADDDDDADARDDDSDDDGRGSSSYDGARSTAGAGGGSMARVHLRVTPEDASLYLDGNFLGSAREVGQLSAGLVVTAGDHRLEVVRPGYEAEEVMFEGDAGEELDLQVDLDRED